MQGHRAESLRIEGMADPRGTQDYNYILGERRAAAVKRYLVNLGMDPDQLSTVSYGSIRLLCHREDETCYQANRRAHLVLTPAGNNALSSAHLRRGTLTQSEASR
jgi:peptidoglycan-associated lipoprotein